MTFMCFRVFVNDTSQFLAPYKASVKSRGDADSPEGESCSSVLSGQVTSSQSNADPKVPGVSASHVRHFLQAIQFISTFLIITFP